MSGYVCIMHVCVCYCQVPQAGKLSNLASGDFMLMVKLIEKFVNNCASITGREHPNLRAPLLSQVK